MKALKLLVLGMLTVALALPVNAGEITVGKSTSTVYAHIGDIITYGQVYVEDPNASFPLRIERTYDDFGVGSPAQFRTEPVPGLEPVFTLAPKGQTGDRKTTSISFEVTADLVFNDDEDNIDPNVLKVRNRFYAEGWTIKDTGEVFTSGVAVEDVKVLKPCIEVTKTVEPTTSKVGDEVVYTIDICNCGNAELTLTRILDTLLGDIDTSECPTLAGGKYKWVGPEPRDYELQPGGCCTITIPYTIKPGDPDPLVNTVCVDANDALGGPDGEVSACATAIVELVEVGIEIDKTVEPGISKVGDEVLYTICIRNTGEWPLEDVEVTDPHLGGVLPGFPSVLGVGEEVCQDFPYEIQPGDQDPLENCAEVTSNPEGPMTNLVDANDCAVVDLVHPGLSVEMDCPPFSKVGDEVCYTVIFTNTGDTPLQILVVQHDYLCDNIGISCIGVTLPPGGDCIEECCFVIPPGAPDPLPICVDVVAGVVGLPNEVPGTVCCEIELVNPDIDLEKAVDEPNACSGETVTYTICIENTGDAPLENIVVNDPLLGGDLPGFPPFLAPGDVWCEDFTYVVPGDVPDCPDLLENCATVTSNPVGLPNVIGDKDCADICCPAPPPGKEGCTPGFWKNNADKHNASAWCDAYDPKDSFSSVFGVVIKVRTGGKKTNTVTDPTLLQALQANGGGINALARHATAALLNACSDCVKYAMASPAQVIAAVQAEVPDGDIEGLKNEFAAYNEAGCPVNQHGDCVGVEED